MSEQTTTKPTATLSAVVTRADGTVEDLGVISTFELGDEALAHLTDPREG
ncbi:MAG: hypothetical protein ABIW46_08630 [Acidimicrobiales bacterium]